MNATTAPVTSLIDESIQEFAAASAAEAIKLAACYGMTGWPVKAWREPNGVWVHRYERREFTGSVTG